MNTVVDNGALNVNTVVDNGALNVNTVVDNGALNVNTVVVLVLIEIYVELCYKAT